MAKAASKAAMQRALAALEAAGMRATSIVIRPGGEVVIVTGPNDASLTPAAPASDVDDLDTWRERRNGRRAAQGS